MAFCVSYERNEGAISVSVKRGSREAPSPIVYSPNGESVIVGEFYRVDAQEIFECPWRDRPALLNEFCSAMCIAQFREEECCFAADLSGYETLYYYHSADRFILSDSFWDIVKIIRPQFDDVNKEVLQQMFVAGGGLPPDRQTPIKGLSYLAPNTLGRYDAKTGLLSFEKFGELRHTSAVKSLDEAVESLDCALGEMTDTLLEMFPQAVFGLGLSGGLDSRVALHYLQERDCDLRCFNVSTKRPHGILLANNLNRAHSLAREAGCKYVDVEWCPDSISEKMDLLLERQPCGTAGHYTNAFKYECIGMPVFDILLTGGQVLGSHLVGASAPVGCGEYTAGQVVDYLYQKRNCDAVRAYGYDEQMLRRHMGEGRFDEEQGASYELWSSFAAPSAAETLRDMVEMQVRDKLVDGWRPVDIFLEFITSTQSAVARNGAYESRLGTMRSFTLYSPHMFKSGLSWDASLIEDRKVLKRLIEVKMPEFASIGEERIGSVRARRSSVLALANKIEFFIRGDGIMSDEWHSRSRAVRDAYRTDMANGLSWFIRLFPLAENQGALARLSPSRKGVVWAIKRLVDCLENEKYLNFS